MRKVWKDNSEKLKELEAICRGWKFLVPTICGHWVLEVDVQCCFSEVISEVSCVFVSS